MSNSLKLAWSESLSTGNRSIDVQHKYFIDILNELAEAIETGTAPQKIKTVLNLLRHYAEWHFEREETCMDRVNCPSACANKEAHNQFRENFRAFSDEYERGGATPEIAMRMHKAMTDWLVGHIQKVDSQLATCSQGDVTNTKPETIPDRFR